MSFLVCCVLVQKVAEQNYKFLFDVLDTGVIFVLFVPFKVHFPDIQPFRGVLWFLMKQLQCFDLLAVLG